MSCSIFVHDRLRANTVLNSCCFMNKTRRCDLRSYGVDHSDGGIGRPSTKSSPASLPTHYTAQPSIQWERHRPGRT